MQINTLKAATKRISTNRVGRGGKRGKTSGRGTKGQNARAGHRKRPEMRDLIKKLPKLRGHGQNRSHTVRGTRHSYAPVNLAALEASFVPGDLVNPETLFRAGLIGSRANRLHDVKILGTGTLTKALQVSECAASATAVAAIEAAGGTIVIAAAAPVKAKTHA